VTDKSRFLFLHRDLALERLQVPLFSPAALLMFLPGQSQFFMRSCIRTFQKLTMRRLISLCILLSVCAMLLPLPVAFLKTSSGEKDLSQPFPCQNRPCGCLSAEQCWKKCCCFTNEQKVAWGKANNVQLPAYVLEAARKEAGTLGAKASGKATPHCERCVMNNAEDSSLARMAVSDTCVPETAAIKNAATAKAAHQTVVAEKVVAGVAVGEIAVAARNAVTGASVVAGSCGTMLRVSTPAARITIRAGTQSSAAVAAKTTFQSAKAIRSPKSSGRSKWVLTVFAAQCQGQPSLWCCLPPTVLPVPAELIVGASGPMESVVLESERLPTMSQRPPLPPPRIG